MGSKGWLAVQGVVTVTLLALLARSLDVAAMRALFARVPLSFYLASLGVVLAGQVAYAWRWSLLLTAAGVSVPFAKQAPHANAVHGRDVEQEDHPNPKDWVSALFAQAKQTGSKIDWVQCGLCVDERGASEWVEGPRRGSPADLVKFAEGSDNTLVIPTK